MMKYAFIAVAVWTAALSLVSAALAAVDKKRARRGGQRIPEATLLLCGALGGAAAEYAVMKKIRHKTKHKRFMIGLPLFAVLHAALLCAVIYLFVTGRLAL